jgi:hypothetical protein
VAHIENRKKIELNSTALDDRIPLYSVVPLIKTEHLKINNSTIVIIITTNKLDNDSLIIFT